MKAFISKISTPDGRLQKGHTYYGTRVKQFLGSIQGGRVLVVDSKGEPMTFSPSALEESGDLKATFELMTEEKAASEGFTLRELSKAAHATALEKGWWTVPREEASLHMLIVTEIAEATEEARKGTPPIYNVGRDASTGEPIILKPGDADFKFSNKPEGELIELADAVIRIMDYTESRGWDLESAIKLKMAYNKTREHRHGGKEF